mmetsp:Transcript_50277/g.106847  ORF Transcript_50277/g.106847 Transcript_50277/m.106847 type:complete len:720 (-) Transcript_50277:101-2260(-)
MTGRKVVVAATLSVCLPAVVSGSAASAAAVPQIPNFPTEYNFQNLILGVSYGPAPLMSVEEAGTLPEDDWFCDEAVRIWGSAGRQDLRVMRDMGANLVRLYGNNPTRDHTNFLDEAWKLGLSVAPGMSDWPYYQMGAGSCKNSNYNCFTQVKDSYSMNLQKGFLRPDGSYHPSLKYMNILNEPDLKMPPTTTTGTAEGPKEMARALISAFDAMLQAEKENKVTGNLVNFTATFSYAVCLVCTHFTDKPALGQMWTLDDAMRHPEEYGYSPVNDITAAYLSRFTHSFNTQNPATDLQHQFLDDYTVYFPSTPVYIGEYHRVGVNQTEDLSIILGVAEKNPLFKGISFFEFQVAYWKAGPERDFGMFGLDKDKAIASMDYFREHYDVRCLQPVYSAPDGYSMPAAVAKVYGGKGINTGDLCDPNPEGAPLTEEGFQTILALNKPWQTARYIEKVIHHLGAVVNSNAGDNLLALATEYGTANSATLAQVAEKFGGQYPPVWVSRDNDFARCAANREAQPRDVAESIGWACNNAKTFSCDDIPPYCKETTFRVADWVFSRFYKEGGGSNPLTDCDFSGNAIFASAKLYNRWTNAAECLVDGVSTPTLPPIVTPAPSSPSTSAAPPSSSSSASSASTSSGSESGGEETTESTTAAQEETTSSGSSSSSAAGGDEHKDYSETSTTKTEKLFLGSAPSSLHATSSGLLLSLLVVACAHSDFFLRFL